MRGERPVDKRRSIPPSDRGTSRTNPPGATLTSRPVRSGPAEGSLGRIPRGPPSGTSHRSRRGRSPGYWDPGLGHWARRRAPPALSALLRRRALSTTCMGYQHRRALYPPRGVNNPIAVPTTRARAGRARTPCSKHAHTQQRAPTRGAPPPCESTGRIPRSGAAPRRLRTQGSRFTKHPMHTTA